MTHPAPLPACSEFAVCVLAGVAPVVVTEPWPAEWADSQSTDWNIWTSWGPPWLPVNMPEMGQKYPNADSIGMILAQFWHV